LAETNTVTGVHHAAFAHQFDDPEQQRQAGALGMWVFLATEILFFGGLFAAYTVYRFANQEVFAVASNELDLTLGFINTLVLICSSFTMATAVYNAQRGNRKWLIFFLCATVVLGMVFLGIKAVEYAQKFEHHLVPGAHFRIEGTDPNKAQMFFSLYFAMTGLHALHMIIGAGMMVVLIAMAWKDRFSPEYHTPVELGGLYWHFVDIIWIFLFPLLYLLGRSAVGH
jgi:cytochrome c oxidase subunit 3